MSASPYKNSPTRRLKMELDFEDFLAEKHGEQYFGYKDKMIDDFNLNSPK